MFEELLRASTEPFISNYEKSLCCNTDTKINELISVQLERNDI